MSFPFARRTHATLLTWWVLAFSSHLAGADPVPLFDGATFDGWEGDTSTVWRIEEGVIVGGSLEGNPQNEFLATEKSFENFHFRCEYKLFGTEGFVNGGVQFRSRRISEPPNEMEGYQADIGAGYSGSLYDESRRRTFLARADDELIESLEKPGEWNRYEIIARGDQVELILNGQRTVVWVEREPGMATAGKLALQIHGDCKAEISFRHLTIEELPAPDVPPQGEILRRFGEGQPAPPLPPFSKGEFQVGEEDVVVFAGQENFVRQQASGDLEALLVTEMGTEAPRFRSMAWEADTVYEQWRELNFGDWSEQLETVGATVVVAQFGQMEALDGPERLTEFTASYHRLLDAFARQTRRLVLVSPTPFEKPLASHAPDLSLRNDDVKAYAEAIGEIARQRNALFVDLYHSFTEQPPQERLTEDGIHLTPKGLLQVSGRLLQALQPEAPSRSGVDFEALREAIVEKNRLWFDCWRPANWSFVYGDRITSIYGKGAGDSPSLQTAFEAQRPLVEAADSRIRQLALGNTVPPPAPSETVAEAGPEALSPEEEMATFTLAPGYEVNLFASEREGVVNPTQFAWDEKGRLWVACSPSYPQRLANARPLDYILVLEDRDQDGRADHSWRFAEGLTMVQGVEPARGGAYVCDYDRLWHFRDLDGDGRADNKSLLLSGFGISDTHQLVNSVCHGPDGTLWFCQGLHAMSRVETPWGIARLDRSAIWRFNPRTYRLEGFFGGGMAGANCWGVAFDDYGQVFHKSGDRPHGYWSVPGLVRGASPIGSGSTTDANVSYRNSPEQYHSVGPLFETPRKSTSLEIIGTRAMPEEIQGCALLGGYFGNVVQLHHFHDAGSGFTTELLPDLLTSTCEAFRPVDVNVGPDGALYLADWYNRLIGHYQTSYADPGRDKRHGRIWRITAKGLPSVKPPDLASMDEAALLEQLRSPERWVRYQAKRLLFERPTKPVNAAADAWVSRMKTDDERALLEVAGVYQAHETANPELLFRLSASNDFRIRAYGARLAGLWAHLIGDARVRLGKAVNDAHPRVRLEAVVAASYLSEPEAVQVVAAAVDHELDPFLIYAMRQSARALQPLWEPAFDEGALTFESKAQGEYVSQLRHSSPRRATPGEEIYERSCLACHQPEGRGLPGIYPALAGNPRLAGDKDALIKIVLHGLTGPLENAGNTEDSAIPPTSMMPPLAGLSDQEIADVLTYLRSVYGEGASAVTPDEVGALRAQSLGRDQPWTWEELGQ